MRSVGEKDLSDHRGPIAAQGVTDSPVEFIERDGAVLAPRHAPLPLLSAMQPLGSPVVDYAAPGRMFCS